MSKAYDGPSHQVELIPASEVHLTSQEIALGKHLAEEMRQRQAITTQNQGPKSSRGTPHYG